MKIHSLSPENGKSQVKFFLCETFLELSQQNSTAAFSLTTEVDGDLFKETQPYEKKS